MKIAVDIYTEKPLCVKLDTYFKTVLQVDDKYFAGSEGHDRYSFLCVIGSEKRVAGLGREQAYSLSSMPAGMGAVEARPGKYINLPEGAKEVVLAIETNLFLDPGILADSLGVRLVNEQGKKFDVPLARPDVSISWEGRGQYLIPLSAFLCSHLFRAAS